MAASTGWHGMSMVHAPVLALAYGTKYTPSREIVHVHYDFFRCGLGKEKDRSKTGRAR